MITKKRIFLVALLIACGSASAAQGESATPVNDSADVSILCQLLSFIGIQIDSNGVINSD
jgi:hypothetical protein